MFNDPPAPPPRMKQEPSPAPLTKFRPSPFRSLQSTKHKSTAQVCFRFNKIFFFLARINEWGNGSFGGPELAWSFVVAHPVGGLARVDAVNFGRTWGVGGH